MFKLIKSLFAKDESELIELDRVATTDTIYELPVGTEGTLVYIYRTAKWGELEVQGHNGTYTVPLRLLRKQGNENEGTD